MNRSDLKEKEILPRVREEILCPFGAPGKARGLASASPYEEYASPLESGLDESSPYDLHLKQNKGTIPQAVLS